MSVFRIEKTSNYTVMSNHHLKNMNLSLKAKGIMSLMLSLPDNWNYSMSGLVSICKENITAVRAALRELEENNYLKINKMYPDESGTGRIEYEYCLHEIPFDGVENQDIENLVVENQLQLSTKQSNTKKEYVKDKSLTKKFEKSFLPTETKTSKKIQDVTTIRKMTNLFTSDERLLARLKVYQDQRIKKRLVPEQWRIILEDLKNVYGDSVDVMISQINSAIAGGYMQIVPSWEKNKKRTQRSFDNTSGYKTTSVSDMNKQEREQFEKNLARNSDGSLLSF